MNFWRHKSGELRKLPRWKCTGDVIQLHEMNAMVDTMSYYRMLQRILSEV
jgi:hypothetical protein